jgi:hypothetical protein
MTSHLVALCFDANDANRLARFWAGVLAREIADDGLTLMPSDDTGFSVRSGRPRSRRPARTRCTST